MMSTISLSTTGKTVLLTSYAILGYFVALVALTSTRTDGQRYEKIASKDPTGIIDSNFGRGLFVLGKTALTAVCSPIVVLDALGKRSHD